METDFSATDPLAHLRDLFKLPPGKIYLDGNSLGVLPAATAPRVAGVLAREWGDDLIESWNTAGWMAMPLRLGDKLGRLIGALPGETLVCDTTSINLFKAAAVACAVQQARAAEKKLILSEIGNFPTDLYILESVARSHGMVLKLVEANQIAAALTAEVAVLALTQVDYRTGALHDMAALTAAAHAQGALTIWDLAHSCGALPIDLHAAQADFAVGCGYKYLNGGPGAPAFVWVAKRFHDAAPQPLQGWLGHAAPFDFVPGYRPASGILQYLCSSPSVIALAALECGVDTLLAAEPHGGMAALRAKSLALTDHFIAEVERHAPPGCLTLVTPREHARRGSQVSFAAATDVDGYAVVQALIAQGIVGDFRAPHILRFGFTPLYLSLAETSRAAQALCEVLRLRTWDQPQFRQRKAVT